MSETVRQRIERHLRDPQTINIETVRNGAGQLRDLLMTTGIRDARILDPEVTQNVGDNPDMNLYTYKLKSIRGYVPSLDILEFPVASHLAIETTPVPMWVEEYVKHKKSIVAGFVGPTTVNEYPNNGFYTTSEPSGVVFMETNPPGGRRGAIAITNDDKTELVDDQRKWEIVNSGFEGYKRLSGTSMYFRKDDPLEDKELFHPSERYLVSYLIQYTSPDGPRLSYVLTQHLLSRYIIKLMLDDHADRIGIDDYMAVEMELTGSTYMVKHATRRLTVSAEESMKKRHDHYVIVPNTTASSHIQLLW